MRYFYVLLLLSFSGFAQDMLQAQHCGYDFTSYLVFDVREEGAKENIKGLKLTLVDLNGKELLNLNNKFSWNNDNKPLQFSFNYLINQEDKTEFSNTAKKDRWFFPYAKDNYFLSITNSFPADEVKVKIEDIDGIKNGGYFETQIVDLGFFDMFVLCTNQAQEYVVQFGRKANKPVTVILKKKEN